ncbi:MAG: DUF2975 domain-containing protein [Novosphingobium sp.]|nr:DUF2975 domain-containing protein [Novosphingobium sp.]
MAQRPRDPLLVIAKSALSVSMGIMLIAAVGLAIAMPVSLFMRAEIAEKLTGHGAPVEAVWVLIAILAMVLVTVVLGFYFFRHLLRIVASVGDGDPFIPVNAKRLQAMGWITVAVQVLVIPVTVMGGWIEHVTSHTHIGGDLSLGGVLLALILFVLARVFREGARMREELEGTV